MNGRPTTEEELHAYVAAAQGGKAVLVPQTFQHDPGLLLRRILPARRPPDFPHCVLSRRRTSQRFLAD